MITKRCKIIALALVLSMVGWEVSCALASSLYTMEFHNKSDKTMQYTLYELDHLNVKFKSEIVRVAEGVLAPDESNIITVPTGAYYIAWFDEGEAVLIDGTRFTHYSDTVFVFK